MRTESPASVDEAFFEPALHVVRNYSRHARDSDDGLGDEQYLRLGLQRALDGDESGRAFLQARGDNGTPLPRSTWFDALQSPRRLRVIEEVATQSYPRFERVLEGRDWLGEFPELGERAVWAIDGHQIEHACHAPRDDKGRAVPAGLIYGMCLHVGLMRPMDWFQGDGKRRHEWPVFKEGWRSWVTQDSRPRLPIAVVDPAYIDVLFWVIEKLNKQAVFICREKENMKPTIIGRNAFDPSDPVNLGVEADEMAGYTHGYLRRIRFKDPTTGEVYIFITTDPWLRPGVVALIYLLRWKIEKAYDVFKNKLFARKAWANGRTALLQQGHFLALLHNLFTLMLHRLEGLGIREQKVERRHAQAPDGVPSHRMVRHVQTLTCQFIRAVRNLIAQSSGWDEALPLFKLRLECYL